MFGPRVVLTSARIFHDGPQGPSLCDHSCHTPAVGQRESRLDAVPPGPCRSGRSRHGAWCGQSGHAVQAAPMVLVRPSRPGLARGQEQFLTTPSYVRQIASSYPINMKAQTRNVRRLRTRPSGTSYACPGANATVPPWPSAITQALVPPSPRENAAPGVVCL